MQKPVFEKRPTGKKIFLLRRKTTLFFVGSFLCVYASCFRSSEVKEITPAVSENSAAEYGLLKLSEYNFFQGNLADLEPAGGVITYDLNMPLFSDYAHKARFLKLPENRQAIYNNDSVFYFPEGTVLIKNFFYMNDFRDSMKGRRILETRLLIHEKSGWKALPYIWNEAQTEAFLEIAGGKKDVEWVHSDGSKKNLNYTIPNVNQCKGCHNIGGKMIPIGPTARQLNKNFLYSDGEKNQLLKWKEAGILSGVPANLDECPRVPDWDNHEDGTAEERARAYLEINCAHCHNSAGPANTSGLFLDVFEKRPTHLGIFKTPVAAGKGSGNLLYAIVPGKPEESITVFRMKSTDPGVMMPELGRKLVHEEGVAAVEKWIAEM